MSKTVEIVKEWVDFEEQHPTGTLEDFCKQFLSSKENSKKMYMMLPAYPTISRFIH